MAIWGKWLMIPSRALWVNKLGAKKTLGYEPTRYKRNSNTNANGNWKKQGRRAEGRETIVVAPLERSWWDCFVLDRLMVYAKICLFRV
jgi:hypothetical protein